MAHEPVDFVLSLLAEVRRLGTQKFQANPVKLHSFFYSCRCDPQFTNLVGDFVFDTRDYFPLSETLEEALDALQFAGYLERTNPRGTYYLLADSLPNVFDRTVRGKFSKQELETVNRLAQRFVQDVPVIPEPARA
jgi:hypothetical protein